MNGIERIQQTFRRSKPLIGYLMVGDGGMDKIFAVAMALIEGGVDILELGMPFSDPIADGPMIQRAAMRALMHGTTLQDVLLLAQKIRQHSEVPLILFSYFNPILAVLKTSFLESARQVGIDGILVVDCPLEESTVFYQSCLDQQIAPIYVITPSTPLARLRQIDQQGQGFLYYACRKGTTGVKTALPDDFVEKIQIIKKQVNLPVVVGFGISNREMARQVLKYADGVVVGSLFVQALEQGITMNALKEMVRSFLR